ncbi:hypothetical protein B9Z55_019160 [Caenorhabditis nigoni]|uniref:Uncharacterized protein n=1 Tax=Caenorhabditis nigoni TaxID=1611254 RepID=A0A2G5THX1_9PELO|nr:hypothetical protein B9Z55_019160 [Caenorhabditis nigoni]
MDVALFEVGDICVCLYQGKTPYEAKVIEIKKIQGVQNYIVHYKNWNNRYDEKIPFGQEEGKIFKCTMEEFTEKYGGKLPGLHSGPADETSGAGPSGSGPDGKSPDGTLNKSKTPTITSTKDLFTKELIKILVDDHEKVCHGFITTVPAQVPLDQIIEEYIEVVRKKEQENAGQPEKIEAKLITVDTAHGIAKFFNAVFGHQLLYSEERLQYNDLARQKAVEKGVKIENIASVPAELFRPSEVYGIIHLLRMLSKLPELTRLIKWNEHLLNLFMSEVRDFLEFLDKNSSKYHSGEGCYETEGGEHRRAVAASLK